MQKLCLMMNKYKKRIKYGTNLAMVFDIQEKVNFVLFLTALHPIKTHH